MSGGVVYGYTASLRFSLINFDAPRWHTEDWRNWQLLDAILASLKALPLTGVWANGTTYAVGDRVVDTLTSATYLCQVQHTSAASGTFSADRAAHPTYWTTVTIVPLYRGAWASSIAYTNGDIVLLNAQTYYLCTTSHTSGGTLAADSGKWALIFDISALNNTYYGAAASNPTAKPNGAASTAGDVYYNTTVPELRVYTGATWTTFGAAPSTAAGISFTPTGNIAATNVQAALAEVDSEKADAVATTAALAGKAATVHTHVQSDVTGLVAALADKASLTTSGTFTQAMTFTGGLKLDTNHAIALVSSNPRETEDTTDYYEYDRTNNRWNFYIGSTLAASIRADGVYTGATPVKVYSSENLPLLPPVGMISYHGGNTAPTSWIKANGAAISRTTYALLFAVIGTTFGNGDGTTTFNVPDLRGEFIRGWDDSRGVDSGRVFGTSQTESLIAHKHPYFSLNTRNTSAGTEKIVYVDAGTGNNAGLDNTGAGTETRPRNVALLACIRTGI